MANYRRLVRKSKRIIHVVKTPVTRAAVSRDILQIPARVLVTATDGGLTSADGAMPRMVERRGRALDDHLHDDHEAPSAAL